MKSRHPILFKLFTDVIPSQGTSCGSERAASQAKRLLLERVTLCSDNFSMELVMRSWESLGIDYSRYLPQDRDTETGESSKKKRKVEVNLIDDDEEELDLEFE